jgi:hypothetical protein
MTPTRSYLMSITPVTAFGLSAYNGPVCTKMTSVEQLHAPTPPWSTCLFQPSTASEHSSVNRVTHYLEATVLVVFLNILLRTERQPNHELLLYWAVA